MSSKGNATDFGDTSAGKRLSGGTSNSIRGVFQPGTTRKWKYIEYVTIATLGNATDFGDLILVEEFVGSF